MRIARWVLVIASLGSAPLAACAREHGSEAKRPPIAGEQLRSDASTAGTMALDSSLQLPPLTAAAADADLLSTCERPRTIISFGERVEAVCFDPTEFPRSDSSQDDAGAESCPYADELVWPSIGERCTYLPVCDDVLPNGRPAWGGTLEKACCYWVQQVCGV